MKRLFVRSRSLPLIVALAVITAMCTVSTASAASPGTGGVAVIHTAAASRSAAASSAPCNFQAVQTCQSTDPTVTVSAYYYGDTSACTFVWNIDWGDSHSTPNLVVNGPADGWSVLSQHTYAAPNTYTILITGQVTDGSCAESDFSRTFTLTSPPPKCPTAFLLGIHGMNEGPSDTKPAVSATIAETFTAFDSDTTKLGNNAVKQVALPYKTITIGNFLAPNDGTVNGLKTVDDTANTLLNDVKASHKQCPSTRILLAGYSMGAWIINDMLTKMLAKPGDWAGIKGIELYGDPCYISGSYKGLVRETYPDLNHCMLDSWYPYPEPANFVPFKAQSQCYYHDPICGRGFTGKNLFDKQRLFTLAQCNYTPSPSKAGACPHFNYEVGGPGKGETAKGGKFLAQHA